MVNWDELIEKADAGDVDAQIRVANHIVWEKKGTITPEMAERAVRYYENAAEQGNSDAMINLGTMYRLGKGVDRDMEKCFYWTKRAAAMLNPMAYQYLGYHLGIPVGYSDINDDTADYKTVFDCFFKGAVLDDANSMYKVGDMYFTGKFVQKDQQFAFRLYKKSDELCDYPSASLNLRLGECYCFGIGTEQDIDEARIRLEDAISEYEERASAENEAPEFFMEGFNRAKNLLKRIESNKIPGKPIDVAVKKKNDEYAAFVAGEQLNYPEPPFPTDEIEKLKSENPVIEYLPGSVSFNDLLTKSELGNTYMMYHLALFLHQRYWFESKNEVMITLALHYFHKAARLGYSAALYSLGGIYRKGDGVDVDKRKALLFFEQSNEIIAQEEIGIFYLNGDIFEQDFEKAFKCFAKCALFKKQYDYAALSELAHMYHHGIFVEADEKFAEYLSDESKKRGKSVEGSV